MNCPKCNKEIQSNSKFCPECGEKLPVTASGKGDIIVTNGVAKVDSHDTHITIDRQIIQQGQSGTSDIVECPICGRMNELKNVFNCRTCVKKYLCLIHFDESANMCAKCAEEERGKLKAEEEARLKAEEEANRIAAWEARQRIEEGEEVKLEEEPRGKKSQKLPKSRWEELEKRWYETLWKRNSAIVLGDTTDDIEDIIKLPLSRESAVKLLISIEEYDTKYRAGEPLFFVDILDILESDQRMILKELPEEDWEKLCESDSIVSAYYSHYFKKTSKANEIIRCMKRVESEAEDFIDWINLAEAQVNLFDDRMKAESCLNKAEDIASLPYHWVQLAISTGKLVNDKEKAHKYMVKAQSIFNKMSDEELDDSAISLLDLATAWINLTDDKAMAQKCLTKGEEVSWLWPYLAQAWIRLFDDKGKADRCLKEGEDDADSSTLAEAWAKLFDNKERAELCLRNGEDIAEDFWDWTRLAEAWLKLFDNKGRAELCLRNFEDTAEDFDNCVHLAEAWMDLFDDRAKAKKCLKKAEDIGVILLKWKEVAEAYKKLFGDREARNCLIRSEAHTKLVINWIDLSNYWMELFNDKIKAKQCLNKGGDIAGDYAYSSWEWTELASAWETLGDQSKARECQRKAEALEDEEEDENVEEGENKEESGVDVTLLTIGIERIGGVIAPLIPKGSPIPTSKSQIFSTAADNQPSVEIHVLQGERPLVADNRTLGRFMLDILPAPRGVPQVEVTFDIDANGILSVRAQDKGTGREQKINVTASSGLSKVEVEKIQREADVHKAEDAKRLENIETRNKAEIMVHNAEKALHEQKDKVNTVLKKEIEGKIASVCLALQGTDIDSVYSTVQELSDAMLKVGAAIYGQ